MAERKSGPVKPPVIDLTARETATTPPAETPVEAPATTESKPKSRAAKAATPPAEDPAPPQVLQEDRAAAEGVPLPGDDSPGAVPPVDEPTLFTEPEPAPQAPDTESQPAFAPPPPRPSARLAMPWSAISIAAGAGAVVGAGLTYLLANWVALPQQAPPFADPTVAIDGLTDRLDTLDARLSSSEETAIDTRVSLDAALVQIDSVSTELRQSIADVGSSIPAAQQPVDLSAIEAELQTLEGRVAAIGAGASTADAAGIAENLVGIEQSLATLSSRLADFDGRIAANATEVSTLRADVEGAKAAIAAQTRTLGGADVGPAVKLPLIVSGLESAFTTGRGYRPELDGLTALLPDLAVPEAIASHAETGLPRPDALAARFDAILPDILSGRTGESTGDWAQDAVEWAKALLALRPAEEMEGDTPEAIVSRLEAAVERRDFIAATALLAQLPAPMRQAAGEVGTDIAAQAEAATFVSDLRTQALAPAAPAT